MDRGNHNDPSKRVLLAQYDESTIRVYQAYHPIIAQEAIRLGTFGPHFDMNRMTWIKPSFLWMMFRCGWVTKENQENVLAIDIKRAGFQTILENAVLSSFDPARHGDMDQWKQQVELSEVRCQWDPDKDIHGNNLDRRAIQLGLRGSMVERYVQDWIIRITDITDDVKRMKQAIDARAFTEEMLPVEREYPLDAQIRIALGMV